MAIMDGATLTLRQLSAAVPDFADGIAGIQSLHGYAHAGDLHVSLHLALDSIRRKPERAQHAVFPLCRLIQNRCNGQAWAMQGRYRVAHQFTAAPVSSTARMLCLRIRHAFNVRLKLSKDAA